MALPEINGKAGSSTVVHEPAPVAQPQPDGSLKSIKDVWQGIQAALPWMAAPKTTGAEKLFRTTAPELPKFDLNNASHQELVRDLRAFINNSSFHAEYAQFFGEDPYTPIFDRHDLNYWSGSANDLALSFLTLGKNLNEHQFKKLFAGNEALLGKMIVNNLVVFDGNDVRMNDISLLSHRLPNGETMIVFSDLPNHMHPDGRKAKAEVSTTSMLTLGLQEAEYRRGVRHQGTIADFGSGSGIQAIALLKMNPKIERAYCLEIEPSAMNYNRLNAMLNGVGDRVVVLDNSDTSALERALDGKSLDFAISNPPFNTVPHEFAGEFTDFGYGGDHGIDVTKIFLDQALLLLAPDAKFEFYSQLAVRANATGDANDYFLTDALKELDGPQVTYECLNHLDGLGYKMMGHVYAEVMSRYLNMKRRELGHPGTVSTAEMKMLLDRNGVGGVRPVKVTITGPAKTGLASVFAPKATVQLAKSNDLSDYNPIPWEEKQVVQRHQKPGGAFIEHHQISGGERIERRSFSLPKDFDKMLKRFSIDEAPRAIKKGPQKK